MNAHSNIGGTAIVPRASIEHIVSCRDQALALYETAWAAIAEASTAVKAAHEMAGRAAPSGGNNFSYDRAQEIERFRNAVNLPDADEFRRVARKLTDLACWGHIVHMTDLERLMDLEAKNQLRAQMAYVPDRVDRDGQLITDEEAAKGLPPITVDNVYATLEQFRRDAAMIFRRGIANAFSKIDRRFKSHDGFKIGSRLIITNMFSLDSGRLSWGSTRDTLIDIERVFAILDGHPEGSFQSTLYMLDRSRSGYSPSQTLDESDYFKVRGFKNGNAHLWFTRDDLLEKVNKLLAEYYGEVIGDGQTEASDPLENRKMTPAKKFGFFPTPKSAVDEMFSGRGWGHIGLNVLQPINKPRLRILEPSAGTGNLARRCIKSAEEIKSWAGNRAQHETGYRFDNLVDCVEIQPELAAGLQREGLYNRVFCGDFLALKPEAFTPYDVIVMNPPFDLERDIDHVTHALKFLKPGGTIHAIMSAGTEFRETRKAVAFRALVEKAKGTFRDLPAGSFAESGTYVNTVIMAMCKPG